MKKNSPLYACIITVFLLQACASYKVQQREATQLLPNKPVAYTCYLIGDAGNAQPQQPLESLEALKGQLQAAPKQSMLLFLGDNIYEAGMPGKKDAHRADAEYKLDAQLAVVDQYKGRTIFIPGNHDWYTDGLKGLKRQEDYIEDRLGKHSFLPEKGCPIEKENLSDEVTLLVVDSQWFLEDWDKHPTINDGCDQIKTREQFFEEIESEINKAQGKTLLFAIHHPLQTNGVHGGRFAADKHLFPFQSKLPLPVLGTLINGLRKTGGMSPADLQNKHYRELSKRLFTLIQGHDNIVLLSGHEHNLQYLVHQEVPIIISGAGSKTSAASLGKTGQFASGNLGFAKLTVFEDASVWVEFFGKDNHFESPLYTTQVLKPQTLPQLPSFEEPVPPTAQASVYSPEEVHKGKLYESLWGTHYRDVYGTLVEAQTVLLDTLYGGLSPVRKGGGHQSKSLRLQTANGDEYVMRAVKKSATRFLQAVAFKDRYVGDEFSGTYSEALLLDFYTAAHPYASLTVPTLSRALGILHATPQLYYVPKQPALGAFNTDFGDELYLIEERVDTGNGTVASFDYAKEIISTPDLLEALRRKDENQVDQRLYIRSRLFDMLLGDWDRHEDQWRWAAFETKEGHTLFKPIPRDRDQVFSNFDGPLLGLFTRMVPALRLMQTYKPEIRNIRWFNDEPFPLDLAVLQNHSLSDWEAEASFIQEQITPALLDQAFAQVPVAVQSSDWDKVKQTFLQRKDLLPEIARSYYQDLKRHVSITGTDKDDWFDISRLANGETRVEAYRIKKGEKGDKFLDVTYRSPETKELWIYGLDDDDVFAVKGDYPTSIKVKLIGGQNNDVYQIENTKKLRVFDYKTKPNTFQSTAKVNLSDSYDLNVYNHKKIKKHINQLFPLIGFNPDDGVKLGVNYTYTYKGLNASPFTQQHNLQAAYYFATQGFDLRYKGEFARVFGNWNLGLDGVFTSPNFAINYFGYGNESENNTNLHFDYNRVRLSTIGLYPKLIWKGFHGAYFQVGLSAESIEVESSKDRFIDQGVVAPHVFNYQNFLGLESTYGFENFNDKAHPSLGLALELKGGLTYNVGSGDHFMYLVPQLRLVMPLESSNNLLLATKLKGHVNIGDDFEFYQAASIGGVDGLRGFRNQRFTGRTAFYQNTDLRLNITDLKTGLLPIKLGLLGGFDYGRVWVDDDASRQWHNGVGGGVYCNALSLFTANLTWFNSEDGNRLAFAMAFNF